MLPSGSAWLLMPETLLSDVISAAMQLNKSCRESNILLLQLKRSINNRSIRNCHDKIILSHKELLLPFTKQFYAYRKSN